jgi:hypothetical protein
MRVFPPFKRWPHPPLDLLPGWKRPLFRRDNAEFSRTFEVVERISSTNLSSPLAFVDTEYEWPGKVQSLSAVPDFLPVISSAPFQRYAYLKFLTSALDALKDINRVISVMQLTRRVDGQLVVARMCFEGLSGGDPFRRAIVGFRGQPQELTDHAQWLAFNCHTAPPPDYAERKAVTRLGELLELRLGPRIVQVGTLVGGMREAWKERCKERLWRVLVALDQGKDEFTKRARFMLAFVTWCRCFKGTGDPGQLVETLTRAYNVVWDVIVENIFARRPENEHQYTAFLEM